MARRHCVDANVDTDVVGRDKLPHGHCELVPGAQRILVNRLLQAWSNRIAVTWIALHETMTVLSSPRDRSRRPG
jgi:hypothetical protein